MKIRVFAVLLLLAVCPFAAAQEEEPPPPPPASDLVVQKTGPTEASAGSNVTYTVTVRNQGAIAALNVTVTDPVPGGMTFVSVSGSAGFACDESEGVVICLGASIPVGQTATFTFVFNIDPENEPGTQLTNAATATSQTPEANEEDNTGSAVTTIPSTLADMSVTKTGPTAAAPGTNVVYTITVLNNGPGAATNVVMEDELSEPLTFVSLSQTPPNSFNCTTPAIGAGGTITCTAATMAAGASTQFQLTVAVPGGEGAPDSETEISNVAIVTADNDPNEENNVGGTAFIISTVDVSIVKTGPTLANAGQNITYTIVVSNAGPDDAINVGFSDTLPPNTTFVSLTYTSGAEASCSANTCTIPVLPDDQSTTFSLVLQAGDTTSITNSVTVGTSSFDTDPNDNSSSATTTITPQADLRVAKSGPGSVTPGTNITWTVTLTNDGPSTAANVVLTDTLPAGTTFVSVNQTSGPAFNCTPAGNVVTCTRTTLAPLAVATFDITANVGPGTHTNTASVTSTTPDGSPGNNAASAGITAVAVPAGIPTLSAWALLLMALALAFLALRR